MRVLRRLKGLAEGERKPKWGEARHSRPRNAARRGYLSQGVRYYLQIRGGEGPIEKGRRRIKKFKGFFTPPLWLNNGGVALGLQGEKKALQKRGFDTGGKEVEGINITKGKTPVTQAMTA